MITIWIVVSAIVTGAVATALLAWQDHRIRRSLRDRISYVEAERDRWRQRAAMVEHQLDLDRRSEWPVYRPGPGQPWIEPDNDLVKASLRSDYGRGW